MENNTIESTQLIKDSETCKNCPYYITEKDKHIVLGKGEIICNTIILLKRYNDKMSIRNFNLLKDLYKREFNRELTEDYYISNLPKCYNYSIVKFAETEQLVKNCINIFIKEIEYYCKYYKNIVVFDDILSNILLTNNFYIPNVNIIYAHTPADTNKFIKEFKTIIGNDRNLGI